LIIYAVDGDFYVLKQYEEWLKEDGPGDEIKLFTNAAKTWEACQNKMPDILLIESSAHGSLPLIGKIQKENPCTKIILVRVDSKVTPEFVNLQVADILLKPITQEILQKAIFSIRHPLMAKWARKN